MSSEAYEGEEEDIGVKCFHWQIITSLPPDLPPEKACHLQFVMKREEEI